jgi:hypothetical protein
MLTIAAATLAAAACRQDDPTSPSTAEVAGEMTVGDPSDREPVIHDPADVVATVDLARGGTITFLDLGDGHIGIAELAPAREEFVSVSMIESQQATPLEVYLALRPAGAGAPGRLVRDHERVTMARSAAPAPRLLAAPAAGRSPLANSGHGSYTCESTGVQWVADWKAAFVGITKYRAAAYAHAYSPPYTFYPGAPVYYGTNTNSKTYLGACNGDDDHELRMEVHRWVGGKWKWFLTAGIAGATKYTFYSGIPARYRGKTYGAFGETVEHYGMGAAWTLSPGRTTP